MAGYNKISKEDTEIFIKLYKKYLLTKTDESIRKIDAIFSSLPTNVIERCFNNTEFYDKDFDISRLDEYEFGFGGLHGYSKIEEISNELIYFWKLNEQGTLDKFLERFGFKVNRRNIGITVIKKG